MKLQSTMVPIQSEDPVSAPGSPPSRGRAEEKPANARRPKRADVVLDLTEDCEAISVFERDVELTTREAAIARILLDASPNPVGENFLMSKVWPDTTRKNAERELFVEGLLSRVQRKLAEVGLDVRRVKDIGIQLTGLDIGAPAP